MTQDALVDLTLTLCCEANPLDAEAMQTIDRAVVGIRAAVALVLFSRLPRDQKLDIARRVEEMETAMDAGAK